MSSTSHNPALHLATLFALLLGLLLLAIPQAAYAQSCLGLGSKARSCTFQTDCRGNMVCHQTRCISPDDIPEDDWGNTESMLAGDPSSSQESRSASRDDGGADAACGTDRRCRIERLKARNRHRRHLQIAQDERAVYAETNRILAQRQSDIPRLDRPWMIGFQIHPTGYGAVAARTFSGHFRAEMTLVYKDEYIYFTPDDTTIASVEGNHRALFGAGHFTYLPSQSWFTPLVSVGFAMGQGTYGSFGGFSRGSGSGASPTVNYHMVTAAVGAEAQFKSGFVLRLAGRHGRLLYNQASLGPGSYDVSTRNALREYMNSRGALGVDFSIGWAF